MVCHVQLQDFLRFLRELWEQKLSWEVYERLLTTRRTTTRKIHDQGPAGIPFHFSDDLLTEDQTGGRERFCVFFIWTVM